MPRFYFHLYDDLVVRDEEGVDLPGATTAHKKAIREARSLMCATLMEGRLVLNHRIEVEDEVGSVVATVPFAEAVEIVDAS
jgi:hypothetical protein